jgi:hypothetical protein
MCLTSYTVVDDVADSPQAFPNKECFDRTKVQGSQGIINAKTILASVSTNFIKISLNKPFFLDKFDICQRLGKIDCL